jgi:hypothetical protein
MSGAVTIVIGGEPVAKGRPRMTRKGFAYTPAATRKYEAVATNSMRNSSWRCTTISRSTVPPSSPKSGRRDRRST